MSVIFLSLSLIGTIYLVKLNQDNRNRAVNECDTNWVCSCEDGDVCKGEWFTHGDKRCAGTKDCKEEEKKKPPAGKTCDKAGGDKCCPGDEMCQGAGGNQTGYNCTCVIAGNNYGWQCKSYDPDKCKTTTGGNLPGKLKTTCNGLYEFTDSSERCVQKVGRGTFSAARFTCPNNFETQKTSTGCADNREDFNGVTSVCLVQNFCGNQQIDLSASSPCTISASDHNCTPTAVPKTKTPTTKPTTKPTAKPTPTTTKIPTLTPRPTNTPIPSNTPTGTLTPTNTPIPTNTPGPTNTPVYIASGPSPTRIVLLKTGVDFPAQALTVVGVIITLVGFLILL